MNSFLDDPIFCYIYPSINHRKEQLSLFYKNIVLYNLEYGNIYVISYKEEVIATLNFFHQQFSSHSLLRIINSGLFKLILRQNVFSTIRSLNCSRSLDRIRAKEAKNEDLYLSDIAVSSVFQSQGLCRKLIDFVTDKSDARTIYLDTHKSINEIIYKKIGFQTYDKKKHSKKAPESIFMKLEC